MICPEHGAIGLYQIGEEVRVRDGTFAGQCGKVVGFYRRMPSNPMVRLMIFHRETGVMFPDDQVERVSAHA